jgi:putative endonuclease
MYFVYILRSELNGRFYIGSTDDVSRRLADHNSGNTPSTKPYRPRKPAHVESFATKTEARKRELQIKSWKNSEYMKKALGLE